MAVLNKMDKYSRSLSQQRLYPLNPTSKTAGRSVPRLASNISDSIRALWA